MRRIFRHFSSWLLLLGITISFVAATSGKMIYENMENALMEVNKYRYQYEYDISLSGIEDITAALRDIKMLKGNVCINQVDLYVNAADVYQQAEILIKKDEDLPYPVNVVDENGIAYLGRDLKKYCYSIDNSMFIEIEGNEYLVGGFIESRYSELLNNKIIIKLNNLKDIKSLADADLLLLNYGTNNENPDKSVNEFYNRFSVKYHINYEKQDFKYVEIGSTNSKEEYYIAIMIFAMINCVVISEFWIMRRKEEIIIRKLCGYSKMQLFSMLYTELLIISGIAVLISVVIQGKFMFYVYDELWIRRVLFSIAFILLSSFIIVMIPVYKSSQFYVSRGVL